MALQTFTVSYGSLRRSVHCSIATAVHEVHEVDTTCNQDKRVFYLAPAPCSLLCIRGDLRPVLNV